MYPWICGRCAREFGGKNLRQLTVHHRDHNHDNNPADGSNWELLCLYCHDNEHAKQLAADATTGEYVPEKAAPATTFKAFEGLGDLLKKKKNSEEE